MILLIAESPLKGKNIIEAISNNNVKMAAAVGHIINMQELKDYFPESNGKWDLICNKLPFIPNEFKKKIINSKAFDNIAYLAKTADEIVLAADSDREGELIHREILQFLKKKNVVKPAAKITRLWFVHGQTKTAMAKAFNERKIYQEYDGWYNAAYSRQIMDWLIGMELTTLYSTFFNNMGVLSIGRVQSWLLSEICHRFIENRDFISELFWTLPFEGLINKEKITFKQENEEGKENRLPG